MKDNKPDFITPASETMLQQVAERIRERNSESEMKGIKNDYSNTK